VKKITFFILCLEGAILSFNVAACSALVPSIAKEFATAQFITGKIIWLYMLPYGIAALFYGPLVRLCDAKKVELVCLFLFSLANLLAALSTNIYTLFAARFLMGLFGASVIPLALILIASQIESVHRGRSVGLFFAATFMASLLGLFLSGMIPWRMIFFIPAMLGLATCMVMWFYLPSLKLNSAGVQMGIAGNYLSLFKNKSLVSIFTYIFLISLFYHGVQQWLGVYFSLRYEFNQFLISMLITLTSLSGILGEVFGGWSADIFGRIKIVNSGILLMIISVFLLRFHMPLSALILIMIIWGLGWTFNHAGISTILTDLPKDFLNEAASLNSSVRFLSGGLGAALGGLLMQRSFNQGFTVFTICLLCLLFFTQHLIIKT